MHALAPLICVICLDGSQQALATMATISLITTRMTITTTATTATKTTNCTRARVCVCVRICICFVQRFRMDDLFDCIERCFDSPITSFTFEPYCAYISVRLGALLYRLNNTRTQIQYGYYVCFILNFVCRKVRFRIFCAHNNSFVQFVAL